MQMENSQNHPPQPNLKRNGRRCIGNVKSDQNMHRKIIACTSAIRLDIACEMVETRRIELPTFALRTRHSPI